MKTPRRMLVGSYCGDKITARNATAAMVSGPTVSRCCTCTRVVEYDPVSVFPTVRRCSVQGPTRGADVHRDRTIIADTMKLLGNSGYGKTITNVDRHRGRQLLHGEGGIAPRQR